MALLVFELFLLGLKQSMKASELVCTCLIVAVFDYVQLFLIAFDFRTLHCVLLAKIGGEFD